VTERDPSPVLPNRSPLRGVARQSDLSPEGRGGSVARLADKTSNIENEALIASPLRGEVGLPREAEPSGLAVRVRGHKAAPVAITRARRLRRDETDVEHRLWNVLRNRQLEGFKFVRQYPIGPYFADFVCREAMLIVELDGSQHAEAVPYDERRTAYLNSLGYSVLRFWNNDLTQSMQGVAESILAALAGCPPPGERYAPTMEER
jgi:very-short-patch-repair endonuclease